MTQCLSTLESMGLFLQQWCNATLNFIPCSILLVFYYIFERLNSWTEQLLHYNKIFVFNIAQIIMKSGDIWSLSNAYNTFLFFCNTLQLHQYGPWCHNWPDFPAQMAHHQWIAKWYFPTAHKLIQLYRAVFLFSFLHFFPPSSHSLTIPHHQSVVERAVWNWDGRAASVIEGDVYCWWSGLTTTFKLPPRAHVSNDVD